MRAARFAALLCLTAANLVAACQAPAEFDSRKVPAAEAILARQSEAWNRGDLEAFMDLGYWHSPELTFFSGGNVTRGFEPVLERYQKRYGQNPGDMGQLTFTDLESTSLGRKAALVRGAWHLAYDDRDEIGGLFTLVLRQTVDGWRVVHDHTSSAD